MSKSQLSHQLTNEKIEDIIEWIDHQPWGKEVKRKIARSTFIKDMAIGDIDGFRTECEIEREACDLFIKDIFAWLED